MAPVIDPGTFVIGRIGLSGHPVAWAWRRASTPNVFIEHYALFAVGDPIDGFLRPNSGTLDLGYSYTYVPAAGGGVLDFANLNGFKTFARAAATGAGLDPNLLTFVRAEIGGTANDSAFLGIGLQRVRHAEGLADPIYAWAQRKSGTNSERWLRWTNASYGYQSPGPAHPYVEFWFDGSLEMTVAEFDALAAAEVSDPNELSNPVVYNGIAE